MDRDPKKVFLDGEKNKNEGRKNLKRPSKKKIQKISVKKKPKAKQLGTGREPKLNEIYGIWDGCQKIARAYVRDGDVHATQRCFA